MSYRKIFTLVLGLVLLFNISSGALAAQAASSTATPEVELVSPGALPGHFGYWFKTVGESIKLHFFTFGQKNKGELRLQYGERRLSEAQALWNDGKLTVAEAQGLTKHYVTNITLAVKGASDSTLLTDAESILAKHLQAITALQDSMAASTDHQAALALMKSQALEVRTQVIAKLVAQPNLSQDLHDKIVTEINDQKVAIQNILDQSKNPVAAAAAQGRDMTPINQQAAVATSLLQNVESDLRAGDLAKAFSDMTQAQIAANAVNTQVLALNGSNKVLTTDQATTTDQTPIPDNLRGNVAPFSDPNGSNSTSQSVKMLFINNGAFDPNPLQVNVGDTVIFRNLDREAHWPIGDAGLNAKTAIQQNGTYSFKVTSSGTINFHDDLNPNSKGKIIAR